MRHLSRRFSGYAYLYMAIAFIVTPLAISLPMLDIYRLPDDLSYSLALFISYFIIFMPPLSMVAVRKYPITRVLRINAFSPKYVWYSIGIGVCLFLFIHLFNQLVSNLIGSLMPYSEPHYFGSSFHFLWPYLLISCLIPAILMTIAFQGIIQSGLFGGKPLKTCLAVGLLYGLLLTGANAIIGATVINVFMYAIGGFAFSYIAVQSGSILPAMIASFTYYLFSYGDFEDMLYQYCLAPLGIGENVAAFGLLALAIVVGGLLIIKMPRGEAGNPLRLPSLKKLRERLRQPWLSVPQENTTNEVAAEPAAPNPADPLREAANAAGDTAKNRNAGFIAGGVLLAALSLAGLIYSIIWYVSLCAEMV